MSYLYLKNNNNKLIFDLHIVYVTKCKKYGLSKKFEEK